MLCVSPLQHHNPHRFTFAAFANRSVILAPRSAGFGFALRGGAFAVAVQSRMNTARINRLRSGREAPAGAELPPPRPRGGAPLEGYRETTDGTTQKILDKSEKIWYTIYADGRESLRDSRRIRNHSGLLKNFSFLNFIKGEVFCCFPRPNILPAPPLKKTASKCSPNSASVAFATIKLMFYTIGFANASRLRLCKTQILYNSGHPIN